MKARTPRPRIILLIVLVLVLVSVVGVVLVLRAQGDWKDGTYTGEAPGHGGPLAVSVTVRGGRIATVTVVSHRETPILSDAAIARIPASIVQRQTWQVDSVAGATVTSTAIREAVRNALGPAAR